MGTTFVSQTDLLFAPVFAWVLCAPKYLAGDDDARRNLLRLRLHLSHLQVAFNWLVDNYQRLSDWRSAVHRVATLLLALDEVEGLASKRPELPLALEQPNDQSQNYMTRQRHNRLRPTLAISPRPQS